MQKRHIGSGLALLALAFVATTGAASAATARASATLSIYDGPGYGYYRIGKLPKNAVVKLAECTRRGTWCRIVYDGPTGWVLGSYLIGSAAKVDATPFTPLVNPFRIIHPHPKQP
jgi:uncharacterized protein YraI